jgi:hypothetical protein
MPKEQKMYFRHRLAHFFAILLLATYAGSACAGTSRSATPAVYPNIQHEEYKLQRKDFHFSNYKAWVKRDGSWYIEGPVTHKGLLCGTYELGMRFGIGKQGGCTDVEWITPDRYVTSQEQCNNAVMQHRGGDIEGMIASRFDEITCAERVVRCSGTCK